MKAKKSADKKTKIVFSKRGEVCLPAAKLPVSPLSREEYEEEAAPWRVFKIMTEFVAGFDFLRQYDKAVTFFGSTRLGPHHHIYKEAVKLAAKFSEAGFAIITGGGPGIMEAANKGGYETGGASAGLNIRLPEKQRTNRYVKESQPFYYFFVRKVMLSFASEIYIFFPGGFGTLDEFYEIITLIQTKKIRPMPIILIGKDYWTPLLDWMKNDVYGEYKAMDKEDMDIYKLADNADEAWKIIYPLMKNHKLHRGEFHKNITE